LRLSHRKDREILQSRHSPTDQNDKSRKRKEIVAVYIVNMDKKRRANGTAITKPSLEAIEYTP
jgi:hypothetical protein